MITRKQVEVLKAIIDYMDKNGLSPTLKEIGETVELQSAETIQVHIDSLEKLGCIRMASANLSNITVTEQAKKILQLLE